MSVSRSHRNGSGDVELELQYLYEGEQEPVVPTRLGDMVLAGSRYLHVVDTYWDTAGLDLRRKGCKLRVRQLDGAAQPVLTWKGASRRGKDGAKRRQEVEVPLPAAVPADGEELARLLRRYRLWALVRKTAGAGDLELREIGQLRTERSAHTYVNGLHRLELAWDRVQFPTGPDQVRLEVEMKSGTAASRLTRARDRLGELFGDDLVDRPRGRMRELCARLYPDLVG